MTAAVLRRDCAIVLQLLIAFTLLQWAQAEYCTGYGHICNYPNKCCANKCCILSEDYEHTYRAYRWNIWNMWYFWFIVIFFMTSCFGGCGYWRRRRILLAQHSRGHPALSGYITSTTTTTYHCGRPSRVLPSLGVPLYPRVGMTYPAQVTNCTPETQGHFPAPPPYAEVITKPNSYPPSYDPDSLPPYPGDPVYTANNVPVGDVRNQLAADSTAIDVGVAGDSTGQSAAAAAAAAGPSTLRASASASAQPAASQWRPATYQGQAAAMALPDEMDSNGNEINSNIYPDNANLQAAANQQPPGYLNLTNQRPDDGQPEPGQASDT